MSPPYLLPGVSDLKQSWNRILFIEPGSPWENGYVESFNGKLRDELLNRTISGGVVVEMFNLLFQKTSPAVMQ